jgi:hypothetical protein
MIIGIMSYLVVAFIVMGFLSTVDDNDFLLLFAASLLWPLFFLFVIGIAIGGGIGKR